MSYNGKTKSKLENNKKKPKGENKFSWDFFSPGVLLSVLLQLFLKGIRCLFIVTK